MPIVVDMVLNTWFITTDGERFEWEDVEALGITEDMTDEEIEEILAEYAANEMEDVSIGYSFKRI